MRIENSVTGRDFRFYSDSGKFLGTMVTNPTGERIYVKSLRSSEFYRNIDMIWEYVNVVSGTHIWNAHVEPAHFKALLRIAGDRYRIELVRAEKYAGRDMFYIEITKRS